jgi:ankyrin repeat protein/catechol 2,3-dioxygenase-like lactoylglutathione lyase family enzyme
VSTSKLPARPSLEYLRKLAKDRLAELRRTNANAQLATALLTIAQENGFSSWRALNAEIDQRVASEVERFFRACKLGDVASVRALLRDDPTLVQSRDRHNATGLYFAATGGHRETVMVLLDAGADVQMEDDIHELGIIGWMTYFPQPNEINRDVLRLLLERGARHHIFSAIALGDSELIRALVEHHPEVLDRRMSDLDHRQTALHFAITRGRHDLLDVLMALGADIDAEDGNGQTALEYAMLRGDRRATERLIAAGARAARVRPKKNIPETKAAISGAVRKGVPIIRAHDIAATLRWYTSIGFREVGRYPEDGTALFWGMVSLGRAEVMFEPGEPDARSITLLFVTDQIKELYEFVTSRQLRAASATVAASHDAASGVEVVENLHEPVFGGLQFSVRDPNGYVLRFLQEEQAVRS